MSPRDMNRALLSCFNSTAKSEAFLTHETNANGYWLRLATGEETSVKDVWVAIQQATDALLTLGLPSHQTCLCTSPSSYEFLTRSLPLQCSITSSVASKTRRLIPIGAGIDIPTTLSIRFPSIAFVKDQRTFPGGHSKCSRAAISCRLVRKGLRR